MASGATSYFRCVVRGSNSAGNADWPADCATALTTRSNLAHLIDESTQTRICWMGGTNANSTYPTLLAGPRVWNHTYLHTWLGTQKPANVDLVVWARQTSGTSLSVRARIVPNSFALNDLNAPAILDETATTTSTTVAKVIDVQQEITSGYESLWQSSKDTAYSYLTEDGNTTVIAVSLMRLEITLTCSGYAGGNNEIVGVYLREYA